MNVGDKVTYYPYEGADGSKGMIKSLRPDGETAYVVFHCDGNWNKLELYTGVLTQLSSLVLGWD